MKLGKFEMNPMRFLWSIFRKKRGAQRDWEVVKVKGNFTLMRDKNTGAEYWWGASSNWSSKSAKWSSSHPEVEACQILINEK